MSTGSADEERYALGIDVGTTYTAAAVAVGGTVEMVAFGHHATSMPSVVYLGDDGDVLTGDAANRRAVNESGRIAREFKRRVGDPTPSIVGGRPLSTELLTSELLKSVTREVAIERGAYAAALVLTYPANWGSYKQDVLVEAARLAGFTVNAVITEPEAAATWYASQARVGEGATIAVFDLGGGTFDATVLRRTSEGFALLGQPRGIDRLGGIDFDAAVFRFVLEQASVDLASLDADDPATTAALAQLRRDCIDAKEALSADTTANVNVFLPGRNVSVRITRPEFEHLISPLVDHAVTAMSRALEDASLTAAQTDAVLLVGGSSRIPLVGRRVTEALGVPVTLDAHPKHSVALGAAQVGARILGYVEPVPVVAAPPTTLPEWTAPTAPTAPTAAPPQVPPTAPPPIAPAPVPPTPPTRSKKPAIIAVVAVLAVAAIAAALLVSRGGGSSGGESAKPLPFGFVDNTNTDCDPDTPAGFGNGIVLTDTGDLLISSASHHEVKRVAQDGEVTTFAGTGTQGSSGDGGPATDAQLNGPTMLAIDSSGAVFIADDEANVIRKVDRNGTISTVLGVTEPIDGVGGMVFDAGGALLVSQRSEGIFRADPNNGFQLDPFVAAESPGAVAFDLHGSLVFQDGDKIRRRGDDGTTTTIAGTGTVGHSGDGGPATGAQTCVPDGIAVDPNGNVYFADSRNERVRGIGTDGIMLTVAGSSAADARSDTGNPQALDLFTAEGVAVNDDSDVFFIDGFDLFEVDHTGRARHIAEYDVS